MTRNVAVVTGTRAEYGLLFWLLKAIQADADFTLQLIAAAAHLSASFGNTVEQIEADGFSIAKRVPLGLDSDSTAAMAIATGQAVTGFAEAYMELQPDIVVLLGDRFEILAAAEAAMLMQIPIAHIHGGEVTTGAVDDAIRHAITKFSHLHFTAAEPYRKRVIQLGEDPSRVFTVGAPGVEAIKQMEPLSRQVLEQQLGVNLQPLTFLITYHPATIEVASAQDVDTLLMALSAFPDASLIFTGANADAGSREINARIKQYCQQQVNAAFFQNLGMSRYLNLLRLATVVIGNSSSGIIEAPALQTPTVNIGSRQQGRLLADSIVNCEARREDIIEAINVTLTSAFQARLATQALPYGAGDVATKIVDVLKSADLSTIYKKRFYDLPEVQYD